MSNINSISNSYFINHIKENEHKFNNELLKNFKFYSDKIHRQEVLIKDLINNKIINKNHIKEIKKFSREKGGFINSKYRIIFYKILLMKEHKLNVSANNSITPNGYNSYQEQIKLDCDRSVLFSIFSQTDNSELLNGFIIELQKYISDFFILLESNNLEGLIEFEYYQGFNDISLYFLLLEKITNQNENDQNLPLLYNLSHSFFKHYLSKINKMSFEIVLTILSDLIGEIDKNINKKLLEITNMKPYYALSWIITWFAHNNRDVNLQFRIIDYLICSKPYTVYFLSSMVINLN